MNENPYRSPTSHDASPLKRRFRWWLALLLILGGLLALWIAALVAFVVAFSFSNM